MGSTGWFGAFFFFLAALGLFGLILQYCILRLHLRGAELRWFPPGAAVPSGGARPPSSSAPPDPGERLPGVSILKPLCGVDDGLAENLASFAALEHPSFEVLL